jgi:ABC-type multidrug transport system ATPase subunit
VVGELSGTLRVSGLRKSFGDRRLFDLDLTLRPGEFCLILGENGVGKSTLFRCLLGLDNHGGTVRVADRRAGAGIVGVLDQRSMYAGWTAAQNLVYLTNDATTATSALAQGLVGSTLLRRRVGRLSTGQKKMLLLTTALLTDAPIVLLDEFANGLDGDARARLRDELRSQLTRGRAFVATGHDLSVFEDLPTRVLVMVGGEVIDETGALRAGKEISEIYATHLARNRS